MNLKKTPTSSSWKKEISLWLMWTQSNSLRNLKNTPTSSSQSEENIHAAHVIIEEQREETWKLISNQFKKRIDIVAQLIIKPQRYEIWKYISHPFMMGRNIFVTTRPKGKTIWKLIINQFTKVRNIFVAHTIIKAHRRETLKLISSQFMKGINIHVAHVTIRPQRKEVLKTHQQSVYEGNIYPCGSCDY